MHFLIESTWPDRSQPPPPLCKGGAVDQSGVTLYSLLENTSIERSVPKTDGRSLNEGRSSPH